MSGEKRKREDNVNGDAKTKKTWQLGGAEQLSPFVMGVFVTCVRGKEHVAMKDALELFNDYADLHNLGAGESNETEEAEPEVADIEASIASELGTLKTKKAKTGARFTSLKTSTECVLFIKTASSIDPVQLVHGICSAAQSQPERKMGGRFIRRLTPVTASADASVTGLKKCLDKALPREFATTQQKTFKIEPTFRNHNVLNRDIVIPQVAEAITSLGPHTVNLKKYDYLVMIEVIRSFIGVSVVYDWERLRKFNLSEIFTNAQQTSQPTKELAEAGTKSVAA